LRARTGAGHGRNRWAIGYSNPFLPVSVKVDDLRRHALVCGATGRGKTSALQLLIDAFAGRLPMVVVDCKASATLQDRVAAVPDNVVWTIGGSVRWDPLRGDPTSVANRLIQGEWYSREADVYRAAAERYVLWLVQSIDLAGLPPSDIPGVPVDDGRRCGHRAPGRRLRRHHRGSRSFRRFQSAPIQIDAGHGS